MQELIKKILSVSLKKKVLLGYLFMSILIISLFGLMVHNMIQAKTGYQTINVRNKKIGSAMMLKTEINGIRAAFLRMTLDKDEDIWDNQEAVIERLSNNALRLLEDIKGTGYKDNISTIEKNLLPFLSTIQRELIPLVRSGKAQEAMKILSTAQNERSRAFIAALDEIIKAMETENLLAMDELDRRNTETIGRSTIVSLVVFIIAFAFSFWFINNYVIKTLRRVGEAAQAVAKGDLTAHVEMKIKDDFGRLADDVNRIIDSIQEALRDISQKTFTILNDVTNMSFAAQEVCHRVDVDLERTTAAATATEQMSSTTADISKNIHNLANSSESARKASSNGKEMIAKTIASIDSVNAQINESSQKIIELASYSRKIDDIVLLIKDIADQTNLLALNAAIEAARAGEQGRGFAVVADEVRKLAQRTANATVEINNILSSINRGTSEATEMMNNAVEKAQETTGVTQHLNASFEEIFEAFNRVSEMAQHIVSAAEQQASTAQEIAHNLSSIAEDSKESSSNIKTMALSFGKFTDNAKSFLKTINNFNDPIIRIGVLKADYILWLNRAIQLIDSDNKIISEEVSPEKSRMGKWYYGEGMSVYKENQIFRAIESIHREFHEKGKELIEAGWRKDRELVRKNLQLCLSLLQDIFSRLDRLTNTNSPLLQSPE